MSWLRNLDTSKSKVELTWRMFVVYPQTTKQNYENRYERFVLYLAISKTEYRLGSIRTIRTYIKQNNPVMVTSQKVPDFMVYKQYLHGIMLCR